MQFTRRERDCMEKVADAGSINLTKLSSALGIRKQILEKDKNNLIILTSLGRKYAGDMAFRHRVLETLFAKNGVPLGEACRECRKIDFILSEETVIDIFNKLKKPSRCPHGKPIATSI
mgnify:CR=1 FL=1